MGPRLSRMVGLAVAAGLVATGCAAAPGKAARPSPRPASSPSPSSTPIPPVLYFNMTEEEALDYLAELDERVSEAVHRGDLGALHDLTTRHGPVRREIARHILRNFRRGVIDRTRHQVLGTTLLEVRSQFAEFRQVRLVFPCLYTYQGHLDVTPDRRVLRQVLLRRMADENLNWKLEREVLIRSEPTGVNAACPP